MKLVLLLLTLGSLLILSTLQALQGISALLVLFVLAIVACVAAIGHLWQQQQRQTVQVLKALANQDTSLTLRQQPQLQQLLQQVQQQIGSSRQQAEARAQYLHTVLSQLDIAVLEFAENTQLLQANPAAQRLLSAEQWQQLQQGEFSGPALQQLANVLQQTSQHYRGQMQWQQAGHTDRLALTIVCTRIQGQLRKLVTLQSIDQALLQQEVQAYQQMTRVLTHEIANSVTPMASLAQSCQQLLPQPDSILSTEHHTDLTEALHTIARRGQHLADFVLAFKQLSQPVQPQLQRQDLVTVISGCLTLMKQELQGVSLNTELPEQALLWLDPALMEQVLINLLQNALDAMQHSSEKQLSLSLTQSHHNWQLDISDSGPGIPEQVASQIFIPFFTTKQTGSGIGLSLCQALLQTQDARISYIPQSAGACFRLVFRQ